MKLYVDCNAGRNGNGSKEMPFKTIREAAKAAVAGDEVLVAPGVYREYVDPVNAGTWDARITYTSTTPLGAVITGAEPVKTWAPYEGNVWVCRVKNSMFGSYNPYTTYVMGDWYFAPVTKHTGAVYLNDRALYEADTLEDCLHPSVYESSWEKEFSVYKWYTTQDTETDETVIYANFQGANPNEENVEINVRRECFMPSKEGVGYITVSGFNINKAATTWAPPAAFQDGMIGPHWSKGWIIEDCEISNSKCAGISLGKYCDPDNNHYFTYKKVKSPTQMERDAVCKGQYHGWLKEKVGSHIVRRCHIHHCEQAGIVGRQGCVFSIIEDNEIHHINNMQELGGAEIAGIKFHAAIDVIFRRNHIHHCTMGIWCDWEAQGTRITQNLLHDNMAPEGCPRPMGGMMSQDIFVEVGHGPTLIDNNLLLSKASLRLATQGVAVVHNLILGALTSIGGGTDFPVDGSNQPRFTPYHIPHRTEVMGFQTILHGDNRFYNNIFVQHYPVDVTEETHDMGMDMPDNSEVGTFVFDEYPTYDEWIANFELDKPADMFKLMPYHFRHLPVWIDGNVYLNGAKGFKKEPHSLSDTASEVKTVLMEENGAYTVQTNVYEIIAALGGLNDDMIHTSTLGEAFEPEECFENPDGTPITFDTDYLGNHRSLDVIPGPFASVEDSRKVLWKF